MARSAAVVFMLLALSRCSLALDDDLFSAPVLTYPVVTTTMSSAVSEIDRSLSYRPLQSIAVVGADQLSAHWLRINNDYLNKIGALGLVINVESAEQLEVLRRYTQIPLVAMRGDRLAEHFGAIYPLLVDAAAGRIRQ